MTEKELAKKIDLTILSPLATKADIKELAHRALVYPFATLCLPPSHVALAAKLLNHSPIKVSTVIGFPLGYETREVKITAAKRAVEDGASEVDVVMNQSAFHGGEYALVEDDISAIVSALPSTVVKVIIEACYLNEQQKADALEIIIKAGAHYIKTSTGFGKSGATVEDVRLLVRLAAGKVGVKAAGGIKTLREALTMIDAGAERLGTSGGIEIIEALKGRDDT